MAWFFQNFQNCSKRIQTSPIDVSLRVELKNIIVYTISLKNNSNYDFSFFVIFHWVLWLWGAFLVIPKQYEFWTFSKNIWVFLFRVKFRPKSIVNLFFSVLCVFLLRFGAHVTHFWAPKPRLLLTSPKNGKTPAQDQIFSAKWHFVWPKHPDFGAIVFILFLLLCGKHHPKTT